MDKKRRAGIRWRVQDAEKQFGELLEASLTEEPQIITKGGTDVAIVVPMEHWRRMQDPAKRSLKEMLLAPEARTEELVPPRKAFHRRPPPVLD